MGMTRNDRLFDLIQILRDGRLHRASELAERLGVPKAAIRLVRGETSRQKTVAVVGVDAPWLGIENNSKP